MIKLSGELRCKTRFPEIGPRTLARVSFLQPTDHAYGNIQKKKPHLITLQEDKFSNLPMRNMKLNLTKGIE